MKFKRKTKKLSGLPIAFYAVALLFFVLLFSFNSSYYQSVTKPKPIIAEISKPIEKPKPDSLSNPEIYVPEIKVLPTDTLSDMKNPKEKEQESRIKNQEKAKEKITKNTEKTEIPKEGTITKIEKDRILTAFIPGTMGKSGKLPSHNCKTKGKLVMFFTVDKFGNVISAGRSSGIKDPCNITAAAIWLKKYVKAKKSQNISQGTYTIVF